MAEEHNKSQHTINPNNRVKQLQTEALDKTADAVKAIECYHEEMVLRDSDRIGNVHDAKTYVGATMVHLALSAEEDGTKVKAILSGYGLEHLL